jgi:hypothetical protein
LRDCFALLLGGAEQRSGGGARYRGGCYRVFVGAGKDGDAAIRLDTHGHFRADQIEAFGAHMAAQQAHAGNVDFRFWRARHHRTVGVAHHDVANTHGSVAILGALDLGAADLDVMAAAEILLDGGRKPRRHHVELDRSIAEPPPQGEAPQHHETAENAKPNCGAPDQTAVAGEEQSEAGNANADIIRMSGAVNRGKARRPTQRNDRPPSPKRRALPVLVRHAPRASPRPWCLQNVPRHQAMMPMSRWKLLTSATHASCS